MRVALLSYGLNIFEDAGDSVRAKRIADIFKQEHEVTLISVGSDKRGKKTAPENWAVLASGRTKLWNLKLIPVLLRKRFDCVYCSNDWRGFLTVYFVSRITRCKIIFEAHSIASEGSQELYGANIRFKLIRILEKFVTGHADFVIALSQNTFDFYSSCNTNIELIPVFVDEELFKVQEQVRNGKERPDAKAKRIGLIGPFDTVYNKYFLEFVATHANEFDPRIEFVAIGKHENGIVHSKIRYTGYLPSIEDYVAQLSCLNAVLVPCTVATTGPLNKILESMSCSLPVFTTPKGMVGLYYLKHGRDIFIFDEKELPGKINELIFDETLMRQVGSNARKAVERIYGKKVNNDKIRKVIYRVCT